MASRAAALIPLEDDAWFTASELEDLALPGLPADKRSINRRAQAERWATRLGPDNRLLVRKRQGRGGGVEFHASLLPGEARIELARRGLIRTRPAEARDGQTSAWAWFDAQKASVKAKAQRKLDIVNTVQLLIEAGSTVTSAVAGASDQHGVGRSTIYTWLGAIEGVPRADWLVALADRHRGGGTEAEIHPELWQAFASDCLRLSKPTITSCYNRVVRMAAQRGLSVPCERTLRRRLEREYPAAVLTLMREGEEGGTLFGGIDIGRKKDLTVVWLLEKLGDVLYTRDVVTMQGLTKPEQEKVIWPIVERVLASGGRVAQDYTGLGIGWGDDAQAKFGKYRYENVTFTAQTKEALAYPVRGAMEDRRLRIPADPKIRADLRSVTKAVTLGGNIRFTAERTPDGHADRFWALALAIHAASSVNGAPWRPLAGITPQRPVLDLDANWIPA